MDDKTQGLYNKSIIERKAREIALKYTQLSYRDRNQWFDDLTRDITQALSLAPRADDAEEKLDEALEEVERLCEERDFLIECNSKAGVQAEQAEDRAEAAERHNAALREALAGVKDAWDEAGPLFSDERLTHDAYLIMDAAMAKFPNLSPAPPAESRDTMLNVVKAAENETDMEADDFSTPAQIQRCRKERRAAVSAHRARQQEEQGHE